MSTVTLTRCVKGILSLITGSTFRAGLFCYRVTLKQFSLSGGGRRCLEDRFWISTDLSHGEGVRDGDAGAICGQRNKTESERHLTPELTLRLRIDILLSCYLTLQAISVAS